MAKFDITKIEGYADMTPEQKVAALEAIEYDDGSAEIERYKNAVTKASSEAAEWKKKHNALLTDEEKKKQASEEEMAKIQTELETLRREKAVSGYVVKLVAQGYDNELAQETAVALTDGKMDVVFANQTKFLAAHDNRLKADILKKTPEPPAGGSNKPMTLDEFHKLSPQERANYSSEHPEEYKTLYGGN